MTTIALLNNVDHADLRVTGGYGANFGDAVNQTRVFPAEFEALQREYPILFRRDGAGGFYSVVLLGLERDENLFLHANEWRARYVPAAHRRGPFSIGVEAGQSGPAHEPKINVDLDHPRLGAGEPVFLRHGGSAPCLEQARDALALVYDGLKREPSMFESFDVAGLIEPVAIDISLDDGARYDFDGFYALSRARLTGLADAALADLHRAGWLAAALFAASSLGNLDTLIALKTSKAPPA